MRRFSKNGRDWPPDQRGVAETSAFALGKRVWLALLLAGCLLALCGCGDSVMERQTFPLCLGLDTNREGKLTLSVQTPMNGSGVSGSASPEYTVFSATGDTFDQTLRLLAGSTPCPLNFSQLRLCVVSYELASKTDLRPLLLELSKLYNMRPDTDVLVAIGNAQEVISAQKPDFGMRMSTHLNIYIKRMRQQETTPDASLINCVRALNGGREDPLLGVCAVNPALLPENQSQTGGQGGGEAGGGGGKDAMSVFADGEPWTQGLLKDGLTAGMLPREGNNPVEYIGSVAVGNGRVSGQLTARETQLILRVKRTASLAVAWEGERAQLQITLPANADQNEQLTPENVREVVGKLQALHCDALGFGAAAARSVYTDAEWQRLPFHAAYPTAEVWVGMAAK